MRRVRAPADTMRQTVVEAVRSGRSEFTAAVLGMPPEEYCAWIASATSWGGEIELVVLSSHLRAELVVIDVATLHVYRYGQGHERWAALLFDGSHYDPLSQPAD